jgi:hypothetical protein
MLGDACKGNILPFSILKGKDSASYDSKGGGVCGVPLTGGTGGGVGGIAGSTSPGFQARIPCS